MYYDKQQRDDARMTKYLCDDYLTRMFSINPADPNTMWYCHDSVVESVIRLYNRAHNVECGKDQYDGDVNQIPAFLAAMGVRCSS